MLPRWLAVTGLIVSAVYLLNQGDVPATATPGFPVWEPAGLLGSNGWGLWVAALGVTILLRRVGTASSPSSQKRLGLQLICAHSSTTNQLRETNPDVRPGGKGPKPRSARYSPEPREPSSKPA